MQAQPVPEQLVRSAEAVISQVHRILELEAFTVALAKKGGPDADKARSALRQLRVLAEALEIELYRLGPDPDSKAVDMLVRLIKGGAGVIVTTLLILSTTTAFNSYFDDFNELEQRVDKVIEACGRQESAATHSLSAKGTIHTSGSVDLVPDVQSVPEAEDEKGSEPAPERNRIDGTAEATPPDQASSKSHTVATRNGVIATRNGRAITR